MRKYRLLCSLCLVACPAWAVETMRIAMGAEVKLARIEGDALSTGDDDEQGAFTATGGRRALLERRGEALTLDGTLVVGGAIRLRAGADARDAGAPSPEAISVNGTRVRGDVVATLGKDGIVLVNVIALEDYLVGVLGSEMPPSFPLEALKAQAVAARTYALQKKLEQYGQPFHLGSSVISQVYGGLAAEDPRTREAVEATRGLVLTFDLQPIEAYFHASCGGRTESGLQALGRDLPYLKPVSCPCGKLPTSEWSLQLDSRELAKVAGTRGQVSVQVSARTPTGRATRVQVGPRSFDAVTFRERLGYTRVKSLQFEVDPRPGGAVLLHGHGFGHGAGLCQWGAKTLADKGSGFREILSHYYPGTELQTLY